MAKLKINPALSVWANLTALINNSNPAANIAEGDLFFSNPSVQAVDGNGNNTNVLVSAQPEFTHYGSVTVKYTRLAIGTDTVAAPTLDFNVGMGQDLGALIADIETAWGLVPGEIEATLPDLTGADQDSTFTMQVTPNVSSLLYVGEGLQVTLHYQEPSLADLIKVTDLDGFAPSNV